MTLNDWQRIAREFGDHDMDVVSGCERCCEMIQQTLASYVGDWLPSEPTAKEILRLRKRVEVLEQTIRWALGESEMDGWFPPPNNDSPWFYWRSDMRQRAALDEAKEKSK